MGDHPGTPRAVGNTWCTGHMAKPRPQVGRMCWSHHQNTPQFTAKKCDWSLDLSKKKKKGLHFAEIVESLVRSLERWQDGTVCFKRCGFAMCPRSSSFLSSWWLVVDLYSSQSIVDLIFRICKKTFQIRRFCQLMMTLSVETLFKLPYFVINKIFLQCLAVSQFSKALLFR